MRTRNLLIVVAICIVALAAPMNWAYASPPDIQVVNIDETFQAGRATRTCGFQVMVHREGTIRVITRYDENGNPVREIDVFHVYNTFIANGRSITGLEGGILQFTFNADGSFVVLSAGPSRWVVQPGGGPVWGATGNLLSYVSPDGEEITIRESGPNEDFNPALCAALTP